MILNARRSNKIKQEPMIEISRWQLEYCKTLSGLLMSNLDQQNCFQ